MIFSLNYLNSLINFSEDSSEISFILNLFSLTIPCLTQVHSYMKTKKIIIEQLYGNYYNIDCLDKTKLKIDQWVSVANKFFSRYDSKKIIDEISHKISSSPYLSNKQDW